MENNPNTSRFNVVVRVRPELGDERTELSTDDDMFKSLTRIVYFLIVYIE